MVRHVALVERPEVLLVGEQVHDLRAVGVGRGRLELGHDLVDGRVVAHDVHAREGDPAVEVHQRVVALEVVAALVVEEVVHVIVTPWIAEEAAEHLDAPLRERGHRVRLHHAPMDHRGRAVRLLPCEAHDLLGHQVEVAEQLVGRGILVGPVRLVRVRVERQLNPLRRGLPLRTVSVTELGQLEVVAGGVVDVEHELRAVLLVQVPQPREIEALEERVVLLLRQVPEEEAVVVDGEPVAGLGVPIPQHAHPVLRLARAAHGPSDDVRLPLCERDFGPEPLAVALGRHAVDRHHVVQPGPAAHMDREASVREPAGARVEHRAVEGLVDLEHGSIL